MWRKALLLTSLIVLPVVVILFYPVASDGDWISSVETKQVDNGATMGITLSGYIYVDGGEEECFIENPAISVPT